MVHYNVIEKEEDGGDRLVEAHEQVNPQQTAGFAGVDVCCDSKRGDENEEIGTANALDGKDSVKEVGA